MNKFEAKVKGFINGYEMINEGEKVLVGLSGGADSVCLLCALKRLGTEVEAVHVNHGIRGVEADEDEEFCRKLCEDMGVPFTSFHKDIRQMASDEKLTVEEAGRKYRYECFENWALSCGASKIAVAHNKNDFVETVLFNMSRGTGLNGLSGIKPVRGNIIRPLLDVERYEIEDYLGELGQEYRIDSTNLSKDYDRNKIRHIVIPALLELNKGAIKHIYDMAKEARENYSFVKEIADKEYKAHTIDKKDGDTVVLSIEDFDKLSMPVKEIIIHEAVADVAGKKKDITRQHINDVLSLLKKETGSVIRLPYGIRARLSYNRLIITNNLLPYENIYIELDQSRLEKGIICNISEGRSIELWIEERKPDTSVIKNNYTKMADYDKIKDTLCIRTPKDGDYIIIDNNGNSKKLTRLFIDGKVDREKRPAWPVIALGSELIWAVGLRYSEAFKVDEATKRILYIRYKEI